MRTGDDTDGERERAADAVAVGEASGGGVGGCAASGDDREHEVRGCGCEVGREAERAHEEGDMDDASADAEEAGDEADDGAVGDSAAEWDIVVVGGAVAVREYSMGEVSSWPSSASGLADQEPDGEGDEHDRHQEIEL